jgi:hypothetical protein
MASGVALGGPKPEGRGRGVIGAAVGVGPGPKSGMRSNAKANPPTSAMSIAALRSTVDMGTPPISRLTVVLARRTGSVGARRAGTAPAGRRRLPRTVLMGSFRVT